ncbi:holo-ACP synthase [Nakamurella multipartita]|uniref:holo-ACP synthase n=1 Tax=Nakamurella multipartita TaxID=53461 RepID=UPI00019EA181|nr:holo-ACP synthase [Nakamurella multipartita]
MNVAIGTDIVEVSRVARLLASGEQRFMRHWFTDEEITYCTSKAFPARHLAARLAVKESMLKALRWRWASAARWPEISVMPSPDGAPLVEVAGSIAEVVRVRGLRWTVSMAHEREWATATVVMWSSSIGGTPMAT